MCWALRQEHTFWELLIWGRGTEKQTAATEREGEPWSGSHGLPVYPQDPQMPQAGEMHA